MSGERSTVVRELPPGAFAAVMATGMVSIGAQLQGLAALAWPLFGIALATYGVLWLVSLLRLALYPACVVADLADHRRGPGFFTLAAGTCVLGAEFVVVVGDPAVGVVFWVLGAALWCGLTYAFFAAMAIGPDKPDLRTGINGSWLLTVVATQAVSTLGALISGELPRSDLVLFAALALHLLGGLLYIVLIALVVYRVTFFGLRPVEFTPDYWIAMGALAITTLAGATLIDSAGRWRFLGELLPFLKSFTLLAWAGATWWIPLLIILQIWRHLRRQVALPYGSDHWSLVFPLGMYSVATFEFGRSAGLDLLRPIPPVFLGLALLSWGVTAVGVTWRGLKVGWPENGEP